MRHASVSTVLAAAIGLAIVAAWAPPAAAGRDICVKIGQPEKSIVAGSVAPGTPRRQAGEMWSVDVAIGDCNFPPATGGAGVSGWPPLGVGATLTVSSGATVVCATKSGVTAGGPAMRKVFRFELKYPPGEPAPASGSVTTQMMPVLYTIRATADVADDTPANNQVTAAFRFSPGGTASCVARTNVP